MITPLLSTKFHLPPSRPSLIPRQRLMERLDEGCSRKVILISAPAGYGKTTLTSQWIKERGVPTAWISLEPDDNNIARFLLYLVTALKSVSPDHIQTSPAMLQTAQRLPVESVLSVLINELATIPHDVYLCADDYHLIESQEIHSAVGYLIEHMPEGTHLVLICRSDPPLPLSRLRARGQLLELRQADLRFTLDEATDFFNQNTGFNLTAEQVVALETRTEGWVAGLQLAAISMRGREALDEFIEVFSGSHRYIIDYLADEIFAQQREDMRHFLQDTSILDRFTASLCNVVAGRNDSDALLRELEENNLFIIPLDDQREWYRYHHLFHEFLLNRLDKQRQAKLHKKASEWFLSNELPSQAVMHAMETGDQATAEDVITQVAADLFNQGAFQTLLDALDALPEQRVCNHVSLATFKGLTLFLLRSYEEALPYAKAAEQCLPLDAPNSLQGQFLSLQAHMALCENQLDQCIRYSQDALESLDERNHFLRNLTLNVLGQVLEMKGDVVSAVVIYRQAFDSGWKDGDSLGAMVAGTNLVFALYELGHRQEAEAWCRQVMDERESHILQGIGVVDAVYLSWGILTYEANELDLALQYAQKAQELMATVNFSQGITWGNYILARIHLARSEYTSAREYIQEGRLIANQIGEGYVHGVWFDALEAQIELGAGNLPFVERWLEKMDFTPHDSPHHWYEQAYFTYTRYLLAKGNYSDVQTLLANMETKARSESRLGKLITILVLQALCLEAKGEESGAVQKVEDALGIAAPQEYRRAFLNEGAKMLPLLVKARQAAPAFADELCLAFQSPGIVTGDVDELIEPLTEREREILRLVARGLSNGEIAKILFITLGTVKKHLNNIFRKLGVKRRIQAVTRGKELGLLE